MLLLVLVVLLAVLGVLHVLLVAVVVLVTSGGISSSYTNNSPCRHAVVSLFSKVHLLLHHHYKISNVKEFVSLIRFMKKVTFYA